MTDYEESDISYMNGWIEGLLVGIARNTSGDKSFDRNQWEGLYGQRVLYSSFPYYPSEDARQNDEGGVVLCNWDDETETKYLKRGVDLPQDRQGTLVTENGTVVSTRAQGPVMFTLDDRDTELIDEMDDKLLTTIRRVYDY